MSNFKIFRKWKDCLVIKTKNKSYVSKFFKS